MGRKATQLAVGDRYHQLVVVGPAQASERGRTQHTFRCDCGKTCVKESSSVRRGKTKSCGCRRSTNCRKQGGKNFKLIPTGTRFGHWTVLERELPFEGDHSAYRCRCDCGKEKVVLSFNLRRGLSTSCGCRGKATSRQTPVIQKAA